MSFLPAIAFSQPASLVLRRARVPVPFLKDGLPEGVTPDSDNAALVDISLEGRRITGITAPAAVTPPSPGEVALDGRHVWPTLLDAHAHLDKGHIVDRTPNLPGNFVGARDATSADRKAYWRHDDLIRRMSFGLRCAERHGVSAIRTHLDSHEGSGETSWAAFRELRAAWAGRIALQAAALVPLDVFRHRLWNGAGGNRRQLGRDHGWRDAGERRRP